MPEGGWNYSNPRKCLINCCLPAIEPWSWWALWSWAAWMDSSQSSFVARGFWSWILRGSCNMARALCGSIVLPCMYTSLIWSLAWLLRISQLLGSACKALLWWSHKSHAMSQSFLISLEVQHLLDLWVQMWDQYCSCSKCHDMASQPSMSLSHPIFVWSATGCMANWGAVLGGLFEYQAWRPLRRASDIASEVFWSWSHCLSASREELHFSAADGAGHWIMCSLSSRGQSHHGQLADDQKCQHCMFLLWAKWPDTNLLTQDVYDVREFLTLLG